MDNKAVATALLSSLNTLVPVAPPQRTVPALQRALRDLLAAEPARARASGAKKNRTRWRGDIATWAPLRTRVLTVLAARGMSRRELAAELGIAHATLKRSFLPSGHAPSRANLARLQGWLEAMEGDGSNSTVATDASRRAYKLTTAERERLAGWRELEEARALRAEVRLTAEVIDQAVAGKAMAPPIIGRLVGFLQQQQPTDSHGTIPLEIQYCISPRRGSDADDTQRDDRISRLRNPPHRMVWFVAGIGNTDGSGPTAASRRGDRRCCSTVARGGRGGLPRARRSAASAGEDLG